MMMLMTMVIVTMHGVSKMGNQLITYGDVNVDHDCVILN